MDKIQEIYKKNEKAILIVIAFVCAYIIYRYLMKEGLDVDTEAEPVEEIKEIEEKEEVQPVEERDLAEVSEDIQTGGEIQPSDLLPMSQEVVNFTQQFPTGQEDVKDKNFLIAGFNIGINTVASSLKNANLQLRSDPYIPRQETGPWNQSTIMSSDLTNRKPLEIGTTV